MAKNENKLQTYIPNLFFAFLCWCCLLKITRDINYFLWDRDLLPKGFAARMIPFQLEQSTCFNTNNNPNMGPELMILKRNFSCQ